MRPRAGIVVTGTEVLTGRVSDLNGPWLAEQLRIAGVDIAQIVIVGDRADDLRWALRVLADQGLDLLITSGGLGPTADDLTAAIVGEIQGRPSQLDAELQTWIADVVARLSSARGWTFDPAATAFGVRKQAMVPQGAIVLAPTGTAPGLVVPVAAGLSGPPIVVLPGPPVELQPMWPHALDTAIVQAALGPRTELNQATLRLWGTPESEIAATLRRLGDSLDPLEITTCLRGGELEIVTRYDENGQSAYDDFAAAVRAAYPATVFSTDGSSIDDIVAAALIEQARTIATAESCTAGMLAARLTDRAGSSAYVLGGLVVYSNQAKQDLAGVSAEMLERVGAVSAEVAVALADGARRGLGSDVGVGITGIAGPGGATPGKPVGLVHVCVSSDQRTLSRQLNLAGSRASVRARTTVAALHLIREMLLD